MTHHINESCATEFRVFGSILTLLKDPYVVFWNFLKRVWLRNFLKRMWLRLERKNHTSKNSVLCLWVYFGRAHGSMRDSFVVPFSNVSF